MSPKYDAFGRPVVPPTEEARGPAPRPADSAAPPSDAPFVRAADASAPSTAGSPARVAGVAGSSAARRATVVATLLVLVVVAGVVAVGVLAGDDDRPLVRLADDRTGAGLTPRSTVERLRTLRAAFRPGERVLSVSLGEGYASVRLRRPAGSASTTRTVSLRADGDLSSYDGSTTLTTVGADPRRLDVEAPGRLIAAVRRGLAPGSAGRVASVSAGAFDREADPRLDWTALVRVGSGSGGSWRGDEHGRHVVRTVDGAPAPDAGERGPAVVPTGTSGRSLLAPTNLSAALRAAVGSDRATRVTNLDVRPERLQVGVATAGEPRRSVTVNAALGIDGTVALTRPAASMSAARVDTAAPARALRRIGRRLGVDAGERVAFVLLQVPDPDLGAPPTVQWLVVLDDGVGSRDRTWHAAADGRRVGRSGEPLRP